MMEKITEEKYLEMFEKLKKSDITEETWMEFCTDYLKQILEENREILVRLKNR